MKKILNPITINLSDTSEYLKVSPEDLNLYFANTYLYFPENKEWAYIKQFSISNRGEICFESRGLSDIPPGQFCPLSKKQISFEFPQIGFYNYKNGVVFFYRRNQRQNKKGLCENTAGILNGLGLFNSFVSIPENIAIRQMWRWSHQNINQLFVRNHFCNLDEAFLRVLKLKDFARAINHEFFVGQGIDSSFPSLWFRKSLIGNVISKNEIIIRNDNFLQEALDFFIPLGVSFGTEYKNA